jgi:hypothetical protein
LLGDDELPEDILLLEELPIDEEPLREEELLIEPRLLPGIELELPPESELLPPGVEPGRLIFGEDMLLLPELLGEELFEKLLEEEEPILEEFEDDETPLCEPLVERAEESVLPGIELEPEFEELPDDKLLPGVEEELFQELFDDEDEPRLDEPEEKLLEPLFDDELPGVESPLLSFVLRLELIFPDCALLTCPF